LKSTIAWPSTVPEDYRKKLELAVAEGVADILLGAVYQHSGCTIVLVEVRYNEIDSSEGAFIKAAKSAMQNLAGGDWTITSRPPTTGAL
jgi:hypothetical protein